MLKLLLAPVICFFSCSCLIGQIPPAELKSAVTTMAKLIEENYVFPEKGKEMSKYLLAQFKSGRLNHAISWKSFDSLATKVIQESTDDGHMFVSYNPSTASHLSVNKHALENQTVTNDPFYFSDDAVRDNFGLKRVEVLEGNIGYIKITQINISEKSLPVLSAAMRFIFNTNALIIDLRDNHGGGSSIGSVLESYFLPQEIPLLNFKSRSNVDYLAKTVPWLVEEKYTKPLFILINKGTASAAEAFAFSLQALKRAIVVGTPSAGAAHMNSLYPVNEQIYISISTDAPTLPGTQINWEGKGVQPDSPAEPGEEIAIVTRELKKTSNR